MTTVWAYKKLKELNDETGFVSVDEKIAAKLLKEGKVQDPKIGGKFLKHIDLTPRKTRAVKPKVTAKITAKVEDKTAKEIETPTKAKDEANNED